MFQIEIIPYSEGWYYCMALTDYVVFDYHLENDLFYQIEKFKAFFNKLYEDRKVTKWLLEFSRRD